MAFKLCLVIVGVFLVAFAQGETNGRIVGGENARPNQFAYQIALFRNKNFLCGGSIIGPRTILTAAHCVVETGTKSYPASTFSVLAGSINRESGGVLVSVKKIIVNENYANFLYDIAVLELVSPFTYTAAIQPIKLEENSIPVGSVVTVSGWGRLTTNGKIPVDLQYTTLKTISTLQCAIGIGMFSDTLLCLSHAANNGVCNGDSGGPAAYNSKLVGVAGFVVDGCGSTNPDGYAKVSAHIKWIKPLIA